MPPTNNPTLRQRRLGAELRKLRERAGLTATGAGELLGVNQARISMIETGRTPVSADRIHSMAQAYACPDAALGQALLFDVSADDIVVAAVPDTPVFAKLAESWQSRPLVRRAGIRIALVARHGTVSGLDL